MDAVCPNDGTRLTKATAVNGAGDAITRWVCPVGDWNAPWFVGAETGELNQIPEVSRATTRLVGTVTTAAAAQSGTATHTADNTVDNVTAETVLAANTSRKYAMIQNNGATAIRVTISGATPTATMGIRVPAASALVIDQPFVTTGDIKAISESGSNAVAVVEVA